MPHRQSDRDTRRCSADRTSGSDSIFRKGKNRRNGPRGTTADRNEKGPTTRGRRTRAPVVDSGLTCCGVAGSERARSGGKWWSRRRLFRKSVFHSASITRRQCDDSTRRNRHIVGRGDRGTHIIIIIVITFHSRRRPVHMTLARADDRGSRKSTTAKK